MAQGLTRATSEPAKDESKPSPKAEESQDSGHGNVAPEGTPQSDLFLQKLNDVLRNEASTPRIWRRARGYLANRSNNLRESIRRSNPGPPGRAAKSR